jgi:bifunctional DNA-binding transcriptional regulator/antitoxin component of YhaV-PrlF toxin-antitoxin module
MSPKIPDTKSSHRSLEPHPPVPPKRLSHSKLPEEIPLEVLAESILTSKGQVTIPLAIRTLYQLDAGDALVWRRAKDGGLVVEPRRALTLADIRAATAAAGAPVPARAFTREEMIESIGQALEAQFGRH